MDFYTWKDEQEERKKGTPEQRLKALNSLIENYRNYIAWLHENDPSEIMSIEQTENDIRYYQEEIRKLSA